MRGIFVLVYSKNILHCYVQDISLLKVRSLLMNEYNPANEKWFPVV